MRKIVKLTESELIALAKKKPEAFAPLYEKYHLQIFNFVYKRVQNEAVTGDLVSTVFLKAMLNLQKYEDRGFPFSSWLYRIALNETNLFFRKNQKEITVSLTTFEIKSLQYEVLDTEDDKQRKLLIEGMNMLNFDQMNLLELRFFESRRFKEIGDIIGVTEDNAKVKVYRAVKKLRVIIAGLK